MAVSGRNWGAAAVQGSTLTFSVGGRPAFRVPLKDVGGVQQAPQEARAPLRLAQALYSVRGEQPLHARALRAPGCATVARRGCGSLRGQVRRAWCPRLPAVPSWVCCRQPGPYIPVRALGGLLGSARACGLRASA